MPSASNELRAIMTKWFGGIDDFPVIQFLESRGYTMTRNFFWKKPVPAHTVREEERLCLIFLIHEWDFGGLVDDETKN